MTSSWTLGDLESVVVGDKAPTGSVVPLGHGPKEGFDRKSLVHRLVTGGSLVEGELEVEDLARIEQEQVMVTRDENPSFAGKVAFVTGAGSASAAPPHSRSPVSAPAWSSLLMRFTKNS